MKRVPFNHDSSNIKLTPTIRLLGKVRLLALNMCRFDGSVTTDIWIVRRDYTPVAIAKPMWVGTLSKLFWRSNNLMQII